MQVRELDNEVIFLHKIAPGNADKSYGIHVARLAGVPEAVLKRAEAVLATLESHHELPTPEREAVKSRVVNPARRTAAAQAQAQAADRRPDTLRRDGCRGELTGGLHPVGRTRAVFESRVTRSVGNLKAALGSHSNERSPSQTAERSPIHDVVWIPLKFSQRRAGVARRTLPPRPDRSEVPPGDGLRLADEAGRGARTARTRRASRLLLLHRPIDVPRLPVGRAKGTRRHVGRRRSGTSARIHRTHSSCRRESSTRTRMSAIATGSSSTPRTGSTAAG